MPESYRLVLRPEADLNPVTGRPARMPGVSSVSDERCWDAKLRLIAEYGFSEAYWGDELDGKACRPGAG
jgi:hypothetical protein